MRLDPRSLAMDINKLGVNNGSGTDAKRTSERAVAPAAPDDGKAVAQKNETSVALSGEARTVQSILSRLSEVPVVDTARVNRVKAAIDEGRYEASPERIADKLIQFEQGIKEK